MTLKRVVMLLLLTALMAACTSTRTKYVHKTEIVPCPSTWPECECEDATFELEPSTLLNLRKEFYRLHEILICMKSCKEIRTESYNACTTAIEDTE